MPLRQNEVLGPANPNYPSLVRQAQDAARASGVRLQPLEARDLSEIDSAFAAITTERAGAVVVLTDTVFLDNRTRIADHAVRRRLLTVFGVSQFAEAGGLLAYGPSLAEGFRRAAKYVDRILKGTKPADLPIEQPTKFELVINLKTAKALGLTIPQTLLQRADQVIQLRVLVRRGAGACCGVRLDSPPTIPTEVPMRLTGLALILLSSLVLAPAAEGQQAGKVYRVGYLTGGYQSEPGSGPASFRQGMHELGYVEGQNLVLDARFADGHFERLPSLVQELIRGNPDVLLVATTPASLVAKAATATIPIVFVAVADPVGIGLVTNLARPERNITGSTHIVAELTGKRLELLKEIVPTASRIAVFVNPDDPNAPGQIRNAEAAARTLKIQLQPVLNVRGPGDLERAFDAVVRSRAAAVLRMVDSSVGPLRVEAAALAVRHRLPLMGAFREDVEAGGLVAYGASAPAQFRQVATFVDKILKGAKPSDLAIQQPTKFELVINLKTAKALGLTIPQSILVRADELIQ